MLLMNLISCDNFLNPKGNELRVNSEVIIDKKYFIEDQNRYCISERIDNQALTNNIKRK